MTASSHPDSVQWAKAFRRQAVLDRVPVSGVLELTSRCNLRCVHCYLGDQDQQRQKRDVEMSTEQVLDIIDQICASGCLYLVITGGDPMMRDDFSEIYRHAREQGLIVTIFCDGVLVTDRIVRLFEDYPPFNVDISVYGATAETYEKVTRVEGSHPKFLRGIQRLAYAGIPFSLKTVLMTINRHELGGMRRMADDLGVTFRVDSAVLPCLATLDQSPMDLRVEPEESVELELSDERQLVQWLSYAESRKEPPASDRLYVCGAGVTSFHIDPFGYVSPCLLTTNHRYRLEGGTFADLWSSELVQIRNKKAADGFACSTCDMKTACTGCPAFNYQETGREDAVSSYMCETTRHRWQVMQEARGGRAAAVAATLERRRAQRLREGKSDGSRTDD